MLRCGALGMDVLAFSWPVQLASLMLDPALRGRKPFGYQFTSVIPNAASMVMVWGVVRSLGAAARQTCAHTTATPFPDG